MKELVLHTVDLNDMDVCSDIELRIPATDRKVLEWAEAMRSYVVEMWRLDRIPVLKYDPAESKIYLASIPERVDVTLQGEITT